MERPAGVQLTPDLQAWLAAALAASPEGRQQAVAELEQQIHRVQIAGAPPALGSLTQLSSAATAASSPMQVSAGSSHPFTLYKMDFLKEFLAANEQYRQSGFHQPRKLGVNRKAVILTCMDSRLFPERFLGLGFGDAEIIRNGGGRVTEDVIRSLIICQDVLECNQVFVIHHTDCGGHAALYHPAAFLEHAKAKAKEVLGVGEGGINMHPIVELEASVREDVDKLRHSDKIKLSTALYGLIFDTKTGALREVCRDVRQEQA